MRAIVNVDSSPQPYQIAASWFPSYQWLQATDGLRLITPSVVWSRSKQKQDIALAQAMIRPYLTTLIRKQVDALVNGGSIP